VYVDKPQFLPGQVSYAYTWAGQHHVLECCFQAEPVATVDWFIKGIKLENNDTFHIVSSGSNSSLQVGRVFQVSLVARIAVVDKRFYHVCI